MAREDAPPSVFVDANVLFSGVHSATGPPSEILALHAAGVITIGISRQIIEELVRNLRKKEPATLPVVMAFFDGAAPIVAPDPDEDAVDRLAGCVNPNDAPIVAAALGGEVHYFVTGDRKLADEVKTIAPPFAVLTPREFIDEFTDA